MSYILEIKYCDFSFLKRPKNMYVTEIRLQLLLCCATIPPTLEIPLMTELTELYKFFMIFLEKKKTKITPLLSTCLLQDGSGGIFESSCIRAIIKTISWIAISQSVFSKLTKDAECTNLTVSILFDTFQASHNNIYRNFTVFPRTSDISGFLLKVIAERSSYNICECGACGLDTDMTDKRWIVGVTKLASFRFLFIYVVDSTMFNFVPCLPSSLINKYKCTHTSCKIIYLRRYAQITI